MLALLPLADQARACLTSATSNSTLLRHVRRRGRDCWEAVRQTASETLSCAGPTLAALTAAGVSFGDMCRTLGCMVDVVRSLEKQPLPAGAPLLALALVRYSVKYVVPRLQQEPLRQHFRAGGCMHLPNVEDVEALLVQIYWSRTRPRD